MRFFGCNIGKAPSFLAEWKKALGGNVNLIAPKHFDGLSSEDGYGVWEFLCYEFELSVPKPVPLSYRGSRLCRRSC